MMMSEAPLLRSKLNTVMATRLIDLIILDFVGFILFNTRPFQASEAPHLRLKLNTVIAISLIDLIILAFIGVIVFNTCPSQASFFFFLNIISSILSFTKKVPNGII